MGQLQPAWHQLGINQLGILPTSASLALCQPQLWHSTNFNQLGIGPASTSLALGQLQPAWHPTSFNQLDLASASTSWAPFQLLPTWHCISFNQLGNRPASIQPTQCEGASIRTTQSLTISLPSQTNYQLEAPRHKSVCGTLRDIFNATATRLESL